MPRVPVLSWLYAVEVNCIDQECHMVSEVGFQEESPYRTTLHALINVEIETTVQRSNTTHPDDGNVPDRPSGEIRLQPARGVAEMELQIRKISAGVGSNREGRDQSDQYPRLRNGRRS